MVSEIILYNRAECCRERLSPFQLWIGLEPGEYGTDTSTSCSTMNATVNLTVPIDTAGPFAFRCHGAIGQYVTLVLPGASRTLNIAELYVFSEDYSPSPPPPDLNLELDLDSELELDSELGAADPALRKAN